MNPGGPGPPGSQQWPGVSRRVVTGKTFDCTAVLANGKAFKITFQMTDENGTVKVVNASKG